MKRLFGTDGIRAVAGEYPLDPVTVRRFGRALADVLSAELGRAPRIVLGRDTRESGTWLRDAVADGAASRGAPSTDAGVITTPGLAFAAHDGPFDAGVMISASHNPFGDNGLKVFGHDGMKIPDAVESRVEDGILDLSLDPPAATGASPAVDAALAAAYVRRLEGSVARRFSGLHLVLDCANGAASAIAPSVFADLGARVTSTGDRPDGRNINLGCGSTHLDELAARVREAGADLGLAFDGDADRCLAVDRAGRTVDGDHVLYLLALRLDAAGRLPGRAVVATIMSNFWLERRLADRGIALHRAAVGDKYVLETMLATGAVLGGEQSGHVIFRERATTGDGILTGLLLLDAIDGSPAALEAMLDDVVPYPQMLVNVRVREKPDLRTHPAIAPEVAAAERALHGRGRVVLRYSGTEPLARVMVEADDAALVKSLAERLAGRIRERIGA